MMRGGVGWEWRRHPSRAFCPPAPRPEGALFIGSIARLSCHFNRVHPPREQVPRTAVLLHRSSGSDPTALSPGAASLPAASHRHSHSRELHPSSDR